MSSPAEYYNSLPPVSKAFGTLCLMTTVGFHLRLINPFLIMMNYDLIFRQFQIWRLVTNFFFLGKFSINFGIRILMIARYGVQLESGPFSRRTADFFWMIMFAMMALLFLVLYLIRSRKVKHRIESAGVLTDEGHTISLEQGFWLLVPALRIPFMGPSIVFMLLYIWSREFSNARVNISGLFTLQGFYLPWVMLMLNVLFGSPLLPDLLGIMVGHLYYFCTVLHPRAGGRDILKTPLWVHKLVARWDNAGPQAFSPVPPASNRGSAFTGRSYRLS
eukprot:c25159_g1_i1 orf=500-1324(-)